MMVTVPGLGTSSSFEIVVPPFGAGRLDTDGLGTLTGGWAFAVTTPPANIDGTAVYQYSDANNVIQTEAGVPATRAAPVTDFYVDQTLGADTGFAMANPGNVTAIGKLVLRASDGSQIGEWNFSPPPLTHTAKFIREVVPGQGSGRAEITLTAGAVSTVAFRFPTQYVFSAIVVGQTWGIFDQIGIGVTVPRQRMHLGDGNFLIEGGGETSIKIKRDVLYTRGKSGTSQNPIFELGRIIQSGDGDPEFRFLYSDDAAPERSVFEFDRKGIVASVKPDAGSHFEGFVCQTIPCDESQPRFRLNSYPSMTLEMGPGGSTSPDVALRRETTSTLTIITGSTEKMRIDTNGNVGIGTPNPQSTLQVVGNYIQFPVVSGSAPSANDCNSFAHHGRVVVRTDGAINLYVCTVSGWVGK